MPVKVIKYTCQFKCRTTAMALNYAVKHEKKCTLNPENKTCRTCTNEIYSYEDFGMVRECKIKYMSEFIDSVNEYLQLPNSKHVKPLVNCPNHNKEIPIPEDENFIKNWMADVASRLQIKNTMPKSEPIDGLPF